MAVGIRGFNAVGRGLARSGIHLPLLCLDPESLHEAARRATGLENFGEPFHEAALRELAECAEREGNLSALGRFLLRRGLVGHLANRLRIEEALKGQPALRDVELRRPLFVMGLPRTGTTLLHNLLALDPLARRLKAWQAYTPTAVLEDDRRQRWLCRETEWSVRLIKRASPGLTAVHPFSAESVCECHPLLSNAMPAEIFCAFAHVPSFGSWCANIDDALRAKAYAHYALQLRILQHRQPGAHWVLKCPLHVLAANAIEQNFPDACIVRTHRDPAVLVASLCSLLATVYALTSGPVDHAAVGQYALWMAKRMARRLCRDSVFPAERVFDVAYGELVREPLQSVRRVHAHFGYTHDASLAGRITDWVARNPRHRHGVHRYRAEDFGLTPGLIREELADYIARFDVAPET